MKVVIQRVKEASVLVDNNLISSIKRGVLIFIGINLNDTIEDSQYIIKKILNLRIFENKEKIMDKSVKDLDLEILLVSQFTLCADLRKGNRPSFDKAMPPKEAKIFYDNFVKDFKKNYSKVKEGVFGAYMQVNLINYGPVTIIETSNNN